ncbi:hypothetical protein BS17DRAFT_705946, partial [Gyrodon lividus]
IWLIDHQAVAVGGEMLRDLGGWIKCQLCCRVGKQGQLAQNQIKDCGIPVRELEGKWALQKRVATFLCTCTFEKELNTVLVLQENINTTDRAIQTARSAMEKESISNDTMAALDSLEHTHECLMTKVNALYASLNICSKFPELKGIGLDFV